jgi:TIGR03987 family protein
MLTYAIIAITLALVFYTAGVWSEQIQHVLKGWHLCMFWIGFLFDTTGTTLMSRLAKDAFELNFHSVTGMLAILLMLVHAVWATGVLIRNDARQKARFHTFSVFVWIVWLIPYISGAIYGMSR